MEISAQARSERLERRVAGLERQLAIRTEHGEDLERQVAHLQRRVAELSAPAPPGEIRQPPEAERARESELEAELAATRGQLAATRARLEAELATTRGQLAASQAELTALLNTKTMRLARRPRRLYERLRANPTTRGLLERIGL